MSFSAQKRNRQLLGKPWPELAIRKTPEGYEKRCSWCGTWLPREEEYFCWSPADGRFSSNCKCCDPDVKATYRKRIQQGTHLVRPRRKTHGTESQETAA